ncbi:hypothetical protein CC1G_14374 [Coprinopsis cinerea okayama7|uniref:Uncharacterized protein n=1 Tax=Coprinopsis cinerea (strain Okayama-7 / 130 / ATCC MYA-4618 / FGSC 9003) TaxID=240176 RepID=D6RM85_COPC7|nr:hypothetical protein CC1G_14374 [Coprinopsis cinerea okayama7\|eukprot:XP_002911377.1 hypothetical protein CC1G_14374 [Coprinopsis cinerea okayama7\
MELWLKGSVPIIDDKPAERLVGKTRRRSARGREKLVAVQASRNILKQEPGDKSPGGWERSTAEATEA